MNDLSEALADKLFQRRTLEAAIRIGLVVLLALWCFNIVSPFIMLVLWGTIIAVAIYPLFVKFSALLGGRRKLAATLMTLFALALLITPTVMLTESAIENSKVLAHQLREGAISIPPPPEKVQGWPLVGKKIYSTWDLAANNLGEALRTYKPILEGLGKRLLSAAAGAGAAVLQFIVSIIIAGVLLVYAHSSSKAVEVVAARLMGAASGKEFADMAGATIRSVAQGVLGVAVIQSILAGIGLLAIGVPYPGIWTLLVLLLAIMQLPSIIILGPIIIYVFTVSATVPAIVFMVWSLLVGLSDNFLKPLLLGRGLDIPMLVILMGAIGGMLLSGIVGLFVGSVVLAVGYRLFMMWLVQEPQPATDQQAAGS